MDRLKLQQLFQSLTGLSDDEFLTRRPLLELAAGQIEHRLKPTVDPDAHEDLLLLFAAVTAQYYDALTHATGATSVKVADLAVTQSQAEKVGEIKHLRDEISALAAPYLTDDSFVFFLV